MIAELLADVAVALALCLSLFYLATRGLCSSKTSNPFLIRPCYVGLSRATVSQVSYVNVFHHHHHRRPPPPSSPLSSSLSAAVVIGAFGVNPLCLTLLRINFSSSRVV